MVGGKVLFIWLKVLVVQVILDAVARKVTPICKKTWMPYPLPHATPLLLYTTTGVACRKKYTAGKYSFAQPWISRGVL